MLSTREYLSDPSQSELLLLTTVVKNLVADSLRAEQKADQLIDALVVFMQREQLTLQFAEDNQFNKQLLELLISAVLDDGIDARKFNDMLSAWAREYRKYIAADRAAVRARFMAQPPGILRTLMQSGDASNIFGDDYDARLVLKGVIIRHADQVKAGRFNVLAPISLDAPDDLYSVIDNIRKGNEDKNYGLLALVNCGQNHWRVAAFKMQGARVSNAVLWDPMYGEAKSLFGTSAYNNLQAVISKLNGDASVVPKVEMQGVQRNGHCCMDRGVQKILQLVSVANEVTQAASDDELRQAVEAVVCENHAELLAESSGEESVHVEPVEDEVEIKTPIVEDVDVSDEDVIAEDTSEEVAVEDIEAEENHPLAALDCIDTKFDKQLYNVLVKPENKNTQIQFDEIMARKLQESLDKLTEADSKADESPLFEEARKHAYAELLKRHGVMAKSPVDASVAVPAPTAPVLVK